MPFEISGQCTVSLMGHSDKQFALFHTSEIAGLCFLRVAEVKIEM